MTESVKGRPIEARGKPLTLIGEEVDAADRLLDLQALLHLARLNIPEPDSFVVGAADETLAAQEQRRAVVGMPIEETDALRKTIPEVRFAMVKGTVQRLPIRDFSDYVFEERHMQTYQPSGFAGDLSGRGSMAVMRKQ